MPLNLIPDLDQQLVSDTPLLTTFKSCIKKSMPLLADRFAAGEPVESLVKARSDFVDQILRRAWQQFVPTNSPVAFIAVGGYGRAELHPASDIDVLILCAAEPAGELAEQLGQLVTFLWDIGLDIGHSVRSLSQCTEQANNDITIATNLMESRYLAGQEALFQTMRDTTGPDKIWPSEQFFAAKYEEQQARHAKYQDTAYNLEPNIKSSPGGLRDIQMIGWVAKRHFGAETLAELVTHKFLTEREYHALMEGQSLLWKIRFALHLLTGKYDDRLSFEYQRSIAKDFAYVDNESSLAVEQFMQAYYRTVMRLRRLNEMLLQLFQEAILLKEHAGKTEKINARFQATNGYLEVRNNGIFARYPIAMLELFLILQERPELKGVRASTIRLVRAHRQLIDDAVRKDIRARSLFMEILRQPRGITHELRRMSRYGVLARYIPEFGNIVGRMQFDLFHIYTVDAHTLMVVRNLRRLSVPEHQHELPFCSALYHKLMKPELIYLAALFHDIAKGRGGKHAELGAIDAHAFCTLHDLSAYDTNLVSWLVRTHLLMSHTAQRKDIDDPSVIQEFAIEVADQIRLDYLFLLTVADIRATDPNKWNSFKQSLLTRLYQSTSKALTRGLQSPEALDDLVGEKQKEAIRLLRQQGYDKQVIHHLWISFSLEYFMQNTPEELTWHTALILGNQDFSKASIAIRTSKRRGCDEILIYLNDRDNLLAQSAALLDQLQLNILEARIRALDNGLSVNSFFVLEKDGSHIEQGLRRDDIIHHLQHALSSSSYQDGKLPRKMPLKLKQFTTSSHVEAIHNQEMNVTELHINAMDKPGLLSRIGEVLTEHSIRVHSAKITTLGAVAEDVFYVTDKNDAPLTDQDAQEELFSHLKEQLDL